MVRQIVIELETPGDSRTMFRLRMDASPIADDLTAVQAHVLIGEIFERITLPESSEGASSAMESDARYESASAVAHTGAVATACNSRHAARPRGRLRRKGRERAHVQPLLDHQRPAGDPRLRPRHARHDGQPAADPRRLSRLLRADRPQRGGGRPRADDGALGHAVAGLRPEGPELRPGRHQRPQRRLAALAAMARRREPMRRPVHELRRERTPAGRLAAAGLVRARREPPARLLRRASGRAGRRCGRSRRARRRTTCSPS